MFEGVKKAWHDYIGDAPVDELYQAKLCAFVTAWELCVRAHQDAAREHTLDAGEARGEKRDREDHRF
jgi:hypothetical protein